MTENYSENETSNLKDRGIGLAQQEATKITLTGFLKYFLISSIFSLIPALLGLVRNLELRWIHAIAGLFFIISGSLHYIVFKRKLKWDEMELMDPLLFMFGLSIINFIGFIVFYSMLGMFFKTNVNFMEYRWILGSSAIMLVFPLLFIRAFKFSMMIPEADYKKWVYPSQPILMPENIDKNNYAIITFIFAKKYNDRERANLQSRAPYTVRLGELFYFYIQEWNHKHSSDHIEYMDDNQKPFGWYFIRKKGWFGKRQYLDPDLTVEQNGIGVNEIIRTERVRLKK